MLPSLYKNVGKTEAKNPLDFGYDSSFLYQPRIQKSTGREVVEGQLQHRTKDGYTEYELEMGANVDKSLKNYIGAPKKDIDSAITQIYKNSSRHGDWGQQFSEEDVRNRFNQLAAEEAQRQQKQEGGEVEDQMGDLMMMEEQEEMPMQEEPMPEMLPDEEMEEDYMDFVINESLSQEEEDYLFEKLNEDEMLSVIFDKVIETASEFAGSGPVEGPGSAVSDSIPARLSDGEFVMTSKAASQIGPDNLQGLMEVAEMEADEEERQTKAIGGSIKAEPELVPSVIVEEEDPTKQKNNEVMRAMDPRLSLFAS